MYSVYRSFLETGFVDSRINVGSMASLCPNTLSIKSKNGKLTGTLPLFEGTV